MGKLLSSTKLSNMVRALLQARFTSLSDCNTRVFPRTFRLRGFFYSSHGRIPKYGSAGRIDEHCPYGHPSCENCMLKYNTGASLDACEPIVCLHNLTSVGCWHWIRRVLQFSSSIPVAERLQGRGEVTLYKSTYSAIRTFCTSADLSTKKCVPCDSKDLRPMTPEAANHLIAQVPEWTLVNEDGIMKLHRSWKVKTFMRGLEFFQLVADVAEAEGHHPDLHLVGWNNVKIDIWTHAVGGLTENDFILAAKISGLDLHHLLSRKAK